MTGERLSWHFLTNHAHVLFCIAQDADITVRELAARVAITERAVMRIIGELDAGGALTRERDGRRNHYTVNREHALHHPIEDHLTVGDLIDMFDGVGASR
ncbi:MAG: helix-turn-helix domain-containing protein [Gemmatimonadota bacterium]